MRGNMKILLIGGTGTISTDISKLLIKEGHELYLLNRSNKNKILPEGYKEIICDINEEEKVKEEIKDLEFDVVADFIAFRKEDLERDYRLFKDKTKQFIFISSASAYQKPLSHYMVSEATPLANPYWQYSRDKIECEDYLMKLYREENFPITIVRPSHTYNESSLPLGIHGESGGWDVVDRMIKGKPVIIHGDGTALWTLTHSSDFAKGFAGLLGNIHAIGESVQIISDETVTWNQIYRVIADTLGVKLNPVYISSDFISSCGLYDHRGGLIGDKANSIVFDNSKLKRLVPDFVARKRMDQGIKESVEYILANPQYQVADKRFDKWCDKIVEVRDKALKEMEEYLLEN